MLERFMSLVPVIILASWIVFFMRWRKSGSYQQFRTSYPFGRILMGMWIFAWVAIFLFILSPVKPARIPLIILRLFGVFTFILALTSMAYGLFWLYQEGIKRPRQDK
jgi:hypothetical protein